MAISSTGIGSGLDVNSIVSQLVALERRPIVQLRSEASRLQTQVSAFGQLQSRLSALRDAAGRLTDTATWNMATASSSNPQAVGVSVNGAAAPGSYSLRVDQLATGQAVATAATFASPSATLGSGTLRIELGRFGAGSEAEESGSTGVDIVIEPGANSLSAVRDRINAASAGVMASIVNDVSGSRLVIRSRETGAENAFRIQVLNDDDGNAADGAGLSALAYDPQGFSAMTRTLAASNARATIDGLAVESSGNTLNGVIPGLNLTLLRAGPDPVDVVVGQDTERLRKVVTDFADAYNSVVNLLREQMRFDATSKVAGPLQGDRTGSMLVGQLRGLLTANGGTSASFAALRDVGFDMTTDGTVKVNTGKLDAALARKDELQQLFAHREQADPSRNGVAQRFRTWVDGALGVDGALNTRTQGLQTRIRSNEQQQSRLEDRVARTEQRLLAQYTALDTRMGQLQGLSAYVTQQMTLLNNNFNPRR
jgi:flagellar hook-associated protein 2